MRVRKNIQELIEHNYKGVVSISHKGEAVFQKAYGYADLPNEILNEMDTKFPTASAGKGFVAVGILQLIEKGKLSFESCIGDILDFDLKNIDPKITVKQLLNHTSGIPDYFDESIMEEYDELWREYPNYKIRTSMDLVPLFIDKSMMYPAGEKFQYNNTGFVVLGLIIEKITGQKFDEYLNDNVFKPCEMINTGYYELDRLPKKCANAYIYDKDRKEYYTNIYSVDVKGTGAGGAFTTALDMEKFWTGLFGGKLLSETMLNEMTSPQIKEGYYGYGLWIKKKENGDLFFYLDGSDPGVSFRSAYDKEEDLIITLISNFGYDVWKLFNKIKTMD
jgi:CubicO group peptidase (beta-lactamase class C family)